MIYLVTGASGHLGCNIVKILSESGAKVVAFVKNGENCAHLPPVEATLFGDVTDKASLLAAFEYAAKLGQFCVIHTAAVVSIRKKDKRVLPVNLGGTENVADLCAKFGARLVYVGSVHAVSNAKGGVDDDNLQFDYAKLSGDYAVSKAKTVQMLQKRIADGLNCAILLPSGIIGANDFCGGNHLMLMLKKFIQGKLPAAVRGEYDFVDVRDVAETAIKAANSTENRTFLVTGRQATVKELLDAASTRLGIKKIKTCLPLWFAKCFAPFVEAFSPKGKTPLFTRYSLEVLGSRDSFRPTAAKKYFDYNPRGIYETVCSAVDWLIDSGVKVGKNMLPKRAVKPLKNQ